MSQNPGLPNALSSGLASEETLLSIAGLVTEPFDTVQVTAFADATDKYPTTVVYRIGGAGGTVVKTLTITYDGSNRLTQIVSA